MEGGELAVVNGAIKTLTQSKQFVVLFEAHPNQVKRTGVDPVTVISRIQNLRSCQVRVTEKPNVEVMLGRPFFEQFAPTEVYNISIYSGC